MGVSTLYCVTTGTKFLYEPRARPRASQGPSQGPGQGPARARPRASQGPGQGPARGPQKENILKRILIWSLKLAGFEGKNLS